MTQSFLDTRADGSVGSDRSHQFAEFRFDCPDLPDSFHVVGFEGVEALNEPYRFTIRLRADHEATDSYQLLGRDVSLTVVRDSERFFHGIVDRITVDHDVHMFQTSAVVVVPALFALSRSVDTRIYQDKTALEIVEEVLTQRLAPYGRTFQAQAVDTSRLVTRNYCVQYRETTLDFVHRLLEEEGIGYYFVHEAGPETLVLFDHNSGLARMSAPEANPVQYADAWVDASQWGRLLSFPATSNRTATSFTTRDFDWRLGDRGQLEHKGPVKSPDLRREHEVYEHGVDKHHVIHEDTTMLLAMAEALLTSLIGANLPLPIADLVCDLKGSVFDRFSSSNTDDRGRVRREWHERDARVFDGITTIIGLSAGSAFELVDHPRPDIDGEYYVTRVTHSSSMPPGPANDELAQPFRHLNYHNRIRCLPRAIAWRPDPVTPKPRIDGVQTATVTGPVGLDVYTDAHGRIKVRFPWDRAETDLSGHYTCWLRVSQTWAGQTAPAFLFIPRVGMEVIVSFIDGDPDRPLVTGCVYNGDNATPAMLPPQATKSIIRTRSVPMGTGYNELSFEDAIGMERVFLRAERDWDAVAQNDHRRSIGSDETVSVGGIQSSAIGIDQRVTVGRNYHRYVGSSGLEMTGGNHTRTVGGTANERVDEDYYLEVGGAISLRTSEGEWSAYSGRGVILESGSSVLRMTDVERLQDYDRDKGITLTSFGSTVHLTQDKAEVEVGESKIEVGTNMIELKVGGSKLVITPQMIQANGKTIPAGGGGPSD